MKSLISKVFMGEDGKVSYTAVAAFHGVLLFWTWYFAYFVFDKQFEANILLFIEFCLGVFFGVRGIQRSVMLAGNAKAKASEKLAEKVTEQSKEKQPLQPTAAKEDMPEIVPDFNNVVPASNKIMWPAKGRLSSPFGMRNGRMHNGIDIAASGNNPIYSVMPGKVLRSYFHVHGGESVIIEHNVDGQYWLTLYAHLRENSRMVQAGDVVMQGEQIGWMGSTGRSTGQHLHFELHKGPWNQNRSNAVNPLIYLVDEK
jgi:murein DD-endopeptidase MepM/ murein hydrolase activator NlpD